MWRLDLELRLELESVMLDVIAPASSGIGLTQAQLPPRSEPTSVDKCIENGLQKCFWLMSLLKFIHSNSFHQ